MFYYLVTETIFNGKTIGKFITKTVVVNMDGSPVAFPTVLGRSFARLIPFEAFSFLGASGRGWHDTLTKTMVVDEKDLVPVY
ncbi:MAG: RDD family protein [Bacteroidota bacterium]